MKEKFRSLLAEAWNFPNMLTVFRLILVPIFIMVYLDGHAYAALFVFTIASITDMFDGYLARKNNQVTSFGKLMDPLADKLLVISALVCHGVRNVFPWSAIIMVVVKEVSMITGGLLMLGKKNVVVHANYWGKTATCAFIGALILGFFHTELQAAGLPLDTWFLWIAVTLAYLAAFSYLFGILRHREDRFS